MKIAALHLQAFGPFTDKVIDFAGHDTNLHLIYGPNEAGKSSALRAMTDLRFGIPTRSADNFVHAHDRMRIAGVFVDRQGQLIGLARRKGRAPTLSRFDAAAGARDATQPASATDEQTLTGGLDRSAFEAMFGLDHERLRKGGELLLEGQGELGAALFEASAGTQGIGKLLAALDDDAKKYYNPHGRTTSASINEARRSLDEARKALRDALTRPADWKALDEAHQGASAKLNEANVRLEALRRRTNDLTELHAVEPLLREYDRVRGELEALALVPDIAETAREDRLGAVRSLARADQDAHEASHVIDQLTQSIDALVVEDGLLEHGDTIDRVVSAIENGAQNRLEADKAASIAAKLEIELAMVATRIAPDGTKEAILCAVPSSADRVALNGQLAALVRVQERMEERRERARSLRTALLAEQASVRPQDNETAHQALRLAVRRAQNLGDVRRLLGDTERGIKSLEGMSQRLLGDMRIADPVALSTTRPLLDAQLQHRRQSVLTIDESIRDAKAEEARLAKDLEEQRLRLRQLAAVGEVVTVETLRDARRRRDDAWLQVRRAYLEGGAQPDAKLVDAFELAQGEADRQADLLRADAERAVALASCTERIEQMAGRQQDLARTLADLHAKRAADDHLWKESLDQGGLPNLSADALKEWQAQRIEALDQLDRLSAARQEQDRLLNEAHDARNAILGALSTLGSPASTAQNEHVATGLSNAIEHALQLEGHASKAAAEREASEKMRRKDEAELAALDQAIAKVDEESNTLRMTLQAWCGRLLLHADAAPDAIRARLEELDAFAGKARELDEARLRQRQYEASINDLDRRVRGVCELIGEPLPGLHEGFANRLRRRLAGARAADQQRTSLTRDLAQASERKQRAERDRAMHVATLDRLCKTAGGIALEDLPVCEERAASKRDLTKHLATLRRQLADASSSPEALLREHLAGQDAASMEAERARIRSEIATQEAAIDETRRTEEATRRALEAIDTSDRAATAREAMEAAAARLRSAVRPWARLRLAHALLREALNRFRERAQAPMIAAASTYFSLMTGGAFTKLVTDDAGDKPVLRAERAGSAIIGVEAMSEGTRDQLYLALRLAALALRRGSHPDMPLVLDDVLITSDDARATHILQALERFAEGSQVVIFTHHRHLIEVAQQALPHNACAIHML